MRIETKILSSLLINEEYCRKVAPFIKKSYFSDRAEAIVAQEIISFFTKFNKSPTKEILHIESNNLTGISQQDANDIRAVIDGLSTEQTNTDWLLENTESFCKDRAVYNAILDSIKIIDGKDEKHSKDAIPSILSEALGVSFDKHVGHDYINDAEERFDYYHRVEERIAFDLELMNKITAGGLPKKSLSVVLAGCVHPDTKIKVRIRKR